MVNLGLEMAIKCEICGHTTYIRGPNNRLSWGGKPPKCQNCGSLERHRIIRAVWNRIPAELYSNASVLQFSLDTSVEPSWFQHHEISIYGKTNTLDLQALDRGDETYDIVICNHVLEHVEDDKTAFSEMIRLLKPEGLLQLTVPSPFRRDITDDWGFPDDKLHGHYRHYGLDMLGKFNPICPNTFLLYVKSEDPVTGSGDFVFFWSKSENTIRILYKNLVPFFKVIN